VRATGHLTLATYSSACTFENPLYDEASIAEAQAKHVGATYHPTPVTGREIADSFADAIWHAETQMFNGHGVAKYLLSRAVRAAGIKVVFTGEGAARAASRHLGTPTKCWEAMRTSASMR
jgi:asparagine synthetase B (glutamine-hydrolysing)